MKMKKHLTQRRILAFILLSALVLTSFSTLYNHNSTSIGNSKVLSDGQLSTLDSFGSSPMISIGAPTSISGIDGPNAMTYDPNNGYTYVADYTTDSVTVLNGNSEVRNYALQSGFGANGITYNSYYNEIYVSLYSATAGEVAVMSPSTGTVNFYIYLGSGIGPAGIVSLPDGYVYVSLSSSNYVDVIHDTTNITDIKVPRGPEWIDYDPINGYVYVISTAESPATISIINPSSNTVTGSVSAPVGTLLYQNGFIYDFGVSSLLSVNGETTSIPPSTSSQTEPATGYSYAATDGPGNNAFIAINGTNSLDIMALSGYEVDYLGEVSDPGTSPQGILYNPITGYLYAANFKSDTVDAYSVQVLEKVTFTESGLPAGTDWGVTVDGESSSSTTDSVSFYLENGSYPFSPITPISADGTTFQTSSSGTVNVNGATDEQIDYTQSEFTTTFLETGLVSGTEWSVTFNGLTQSSTGTSISFTDPVGSYSYTVNSPAGYSTSQESGTVTVSASSEIDITFSSTASLSYDLNFTESGLPSGTNWYVDITGIYNYSYDQSEISLSLHSGEYSYTFYSPGYTPSPVSGSVDLSGNQTIGVQFTRNSIPTYEQTFSETRLTAGDEWYIQIVGGTNFSSTSSTLSISLQSGTYSYNVYAPGFTSSPESGIFSLPSSAVVDIEFSPVVVKQENVTFKETGISQGYEWYVDINGRNFSSIGDNLTVELPHGSYPYTVYAFGYSSQPSSGTVDVVSSPLSVNVDFTFVSFSRNETLTISYAGELYNLSADVNYKYFSSPNLSLTQADLFKIYIEGSLTDSSMYLRNVTIVSQSDNAVIRGSQGQSIMDSLLVWSQLNSLTLQDSFGTSSVFYKNLENLSEGAWTDSIGSDLPIILNFAIVAGQIGTIVTEAASGDASSIVSLAGPIYSILNGMNEAETDYSQSTANSMLNALESYNVVSGPSFNTTTALSNLSHLSSSQFSQLLSSLYADVNPSTSGPSSNALNSLTNAFGDMLQYSPFYGLTPSDSIATVVSDTASLIRNADAKEAVKTAGEIGSDVANSLMDQYFSGIQSSSDSATQQITTNMEQADTESSLQFGPGLIFGISSALNKNFLVPQGQLLASLAGSQLSLNDFYSALETLLPSVNQATPDLSAALPTAYLAQMIKTNWLQWYSIASQLNGKDYSPPAEQQQWDIIMQYMSGNQYNATMFLKSLDLLAGDLVNNNSSPIYTGSVNPFFIDRTSRETLDEFSVYNVIHPSIVAQIAKAVLNYLGDAWHNVTSFVANLTSDLYKFGGTVVNGVEIFGSEAYSELSQLSSGADSLFNNIGDRVSAGWKWFVSLFITDSQSTLSGSSVSFNNSQWIAVSNGSGYYDYGDGAIYSSSLWTYAVTSDSGGLLVTNISPGNNISIEVGSSASVSPFFAAYENNSTITVSYSQDPGILYDYSSHSVNGTIEFTTVMQRVTFEFVNHPSGTTWTLRIMYLNGTQVETVSGNGSYANISLNSGEYKFTFTPGNGKYSNASGSFVVNGSSVVQIIKEKTRPYSLNLIYVLIALIIVVVSSLAVISMRRRR